MNGLLVVFGFYNVVIRGIVNGRTSLITVAGPILIASAAALVLLWRRNAEAAAVVAGLLGLFVAKLAIGVPLPMSLVLWGYIATMVWGVVATFSSASTDSLLISNHQPPSQLPQTQSPAQVQTGQVSLKFWRILTVVPLALGFAGLLLGVGVGLVAYSAVKESSNSDWEGLGILIGGAIAVVSLVVVVVGAGLIALAQHRERLAAGLSMPISFLALVVGTQQGNLLSLVLVLWGLAHLVSAVGVLYGSPTQQQDELSPYAPPPPPAPPAEAIGRRF